jgi:meso-butanediol dehydrogenase/(S,S)-butanediol dehydrogenase/diacetyl reductase
MMQGEVAMLRLSGKAALITGGGTGIGSACALAFVAEGARVAICGRRKELLDAVAKKIVAAGGECFAVECDVTVRASVDAAVSAAVRALGRLNILVNNAGQSFVGTVEQTTDEDWDRMLAVNLTGTFMVSRAALPELWKAGGGAIVNIGSYLGLTAFKDRAAYCAAKGGVTMLTKAMALDHARENIRVNCICPAIVETELVRGIFSKSADPERMRRERIAQIPLGRMGQPEDVARMAVYLASDEASWVTGVTLPLDGGITA